MGLFVDAKFNRLIVELDLYKTKGIMGPGLEIGAALSVSAAD